MVVTGRHRLVGEEEAGDGDNDNVGVAIGGGVGRGIKRGLGRRGGISGRERVKWIGME